MRIAIIGAGFSGCQLAIELMRNGPSPLDISLFDASASFGPGVAFGARHDRLLLNTRVANMSALASDPSHFLRWLWAHDLPEHPAAAIPPSGHAFVARGVYGRYLRDVLDAAEAAAPRDVRLNRIGRGVVGLTDEHGVLWLKLDDDSTCVADVAVLCIGNLPPRLPRAPGVDAISGAEADRQSLGRGEHRPDPAVRCGPGAGQRPDDGRCCDPARRPRPPGSRSWRYRGTACCRRSTRRHGARRPRNGWTGRRPRAACCGRSASRSRVPSAPGSTGGPCSTAGASACPCCGTVCRWSSAGDFSATCGPSGTSTAIAWRPRSRGQIKEMQASGQLEVRAGTIEAYQAGQDGVAVRFRNRGSRIEVRVVGDWLVSCAGPALDFRHVREPLIQDLLARGLVRPEPLGLGLETTRGLQLVGWNGRPNGSLFALGPLTRGTFWETTGVPEIREQGRALARRLAMNGTARAA